MTESDETAELSRVIKLDYTKIAPKYSIFHTTSVNKYLDRFSFIRRHFVSFKEENHPIDFDKQVDLQRNKYNLRTLTLPVKDEDFNFELQNDLFRQFDSVQRLKKRKKLTDLSYKQLIVVNHLKQSNYFGQDFRLDLNPLQKIIFSTNRNNFGKLILGLLNMLFIWFDLGVLDMHPIFILSHDYFLVYLYCHLPIFFFIKFTQLLIFSHNLLKFFETPLYESLKPFIQKPRKVRRSRSV